MQDLFKSVIVDEATTKSIKENIEEKDSVLLSDGSLYIPDRIVPVPTSVSEETQKWLGIAMAPKSYGVENVTFEQIRDESEGVFEFINARAAELYPVDVIQEEIAGIKCDVITPVGGIPALNENRVIINIFGGMGIFGHTALLETIPIANLLKIKVIKPHYRLAPEYTFPDNVDDIITVYNYIANNYDTDKIGMFGASNGGLMVFQTIAKLLSLDIPLPGAIASWGGGGGYVGNIDSVETNKDLDPMSRLNPYKRFRPSKNRPNFKANNNFQIDPKDPIFSPIYSDLSKYPPAFLSTGSRDMMSSSVFLMHQAFREANADAELYVFEAMPHGFIYSCDLPEAKRLYKFTSDFFSRKLGIDFDNQ